jgi:hypothetical protein
LNHTVPYLCTRLIEKLIKPLLYGTFFWGGLLYGTKGIAILPFFLPLDKLRTEDIRPGFSSCCFLPQSPQLLWRRAGWYETSPSDGAGAPPSGGAAIRPQPPPVALPFADQAPKVVDLRRRGPEIRIGSHSSSARMRSTAPPGEVAAA